MPYVVKERRPALDKVVDKLVAANLGTGDVELFLLSLASKDNPHFYCFKPQVGEGVEEAEANEVEPNGDINYILFKYCKYYIEPSYNNYKAFMGEIYNAMESISTGEFKNEFRESAEWIRIKLLTPYEEEAIERNGDV